MQLQHSMQLDFLDFIFGIMEGFYCKHQYVLLNKRKSAPASNSIFFFFFRLRILEIEVIDGIWANLCSPHYCSLYSLYVSVLYLRVLLYFPLPT